MKAHQISSLAVEEYIQQEIESDTKSEYHNGKIYALAGVTINHGLIFKFQSLGLAIRMDELYYRTEIDRSE